MCRARSRRSPVRVRAHEKLAPVRPPAVMRLSSMRNMSRLIRRMMTSEKKTPCPVRSVCLAMRHRRGEGEMKRPKQTDAEIKPRLPRAQRMIEIDRDPERHPDQRVDRHEVGREGDPPVHLVGQHVAALRADVERRHLSAREHGRERMGELVPEHVEPHRARQQREDRQPGDESRPRG